MVSLAGRPHLLKKLLGLAGAFLALSIGLWLLVGKPPAPADSHASLRVMTYSSFMSAWGPGPEIAKRFHELTGISIEFQDAGDAGLILEKLKLFPVDAVLGLDRLALAQARERTEWNDLPTLEKPSDWDTDEFAAIDYAPLAFVYRKGEVQPPTSLQDLLDSRFAGSVALEDPRTSTPGLQFFFWVLDEMGEQQGFEYLKQLKKSVHSVSPSWSTAYGLFKQKQAKLVFSYLTSPVYHLIEDKSDSYAAAVFNEGHALQVEFAGIPANCARCTDAETFLQFLRKPDTQALIMKKNFMLPIAKDVTAGTPFANLPLVTVHELKSADELLSRRDELFEKWRKLGL